MTVPIMTREDDGRRIVFEQWTDRPSKRRVPASSAHRGKTKGSDKQAGRHANVRGSGREVALAGPSASQQRYFTSGSSRAQPSTSQAGQAGHRRRQRGHDAQRSSWMSADTNNKKGKQKARKLDDSLDLSHSDLSIEGRRPDLSAWPNLHKLDLSSSLLTSAGWVQGAASTLTVLNLSGNDFSDPRSLEGLELAQELLVVTATNCSMKGSLPKPLRCLSKLKALIVPHNELTMLNNLARLVELNTLVVSHNKLRSLPDSASSLQKLSKISAASNDLSDVGLPDLSTLGNLREVKLNNNPRLSSLPEHFARWGKAALDEGGSKMGRGLEVVDFSKCGFSAWTALRPLAAHSSVVNLGLRDNLVVESIKEEGFEDYKNKIMVLMPKLRVLDSRRFDSKFFDLKRRRSEDAVPTAPASKKRSRSAVDKDDEGDDESSASKRRTRSASASDAASSMGNDTNVTTTSEGPATSDKASRKRGKRRSQRAHRDAVAREVLATLRGDEGVKARATNPEPETAHETSKGDDDRPPTFEVVDVSSSKPKKARADKDAPAPAVDFASLFEGPSSAAGIGAGGASSGWD